MTIPFDARARGRATRRPRVGSRPSNVTELTRTRTTRARPIGATSWTPQAIGLAVIMAVIVAVGLVFVASSSAVSSLNTYGSSWYIFRRQLQWVGLGTLLLAITVVVPYRTWHRLAPVILGSVWVATVLTLVIGHERNGSKRWIGPESVALQPSEALKFALTIGLASMFMVIADKPDRDRLLSRQLWAVSVLVLGPIALQPDLGTGIILLAILFAMSVYMGLSGRRFAKIGAIAGILIDFSPGMSRIAEIEFWPFVIRNAT